VHLLLIHGMARTPLSCRSLARSLRRAGHHPGTAGYVAALEPFATVCARVRRHLVDVAGTGEPYAVIGHSLGGLILRVALGTSPPLRPAPQRLIMLGTPNRSPRLARRLGHLWPYRVINGEAGQLLRDPRFFAGLPPITVPYTLIAGTGGRRGKWSPFGDEINDGVVAVTETLVKDNDVPLLVPGRHIFLMNRPDVRRIILSLLE
jgi:hypothetical protein